jgi:glycosyltransferase involved in cell wall biosynthesis
MTPLVSIVIPTSCRPHYLPRSINSALACMNNDDIEVIVVPNGPDESWRESLLPYGDNPSIRVIRIKEANANIARNAGLIEACGEIVRFLDDDDYLIPENAVKQYELIQASGADVVSGSVQLVDETGMGFDIWRQPDMDDLCAAVLGPWRNSLPTAHVYRRSCLGTVKWNPATLVRQDIDWQLDLCASRELLWHKSDDVVGVWQHHGNQRISTKTRFNDIQKFTVTILLRTYRSLQMSNRLNDRRREAVALELWSLIDSAFFIEPFFWHKVASTALEIGPSICPLQPLYNFPLLRNLNPLLRQWFVLPRRWTLYNMGYLPEKTITEAYRGTESRTRMNKQQNINSHVNPKEKVSIIIPCYNQAHFLPAAIKSCIEQTYQNIEIIVVDDGSPDNIKMAVTPFKDRIKLIRQTNKGLSETRNVGIRNSSGEFLIFLDADDIIGSDTISSQVAFLIKNPDTNVVVCRNRLFSSLTVKGQPEIIGRWKLFKKDLGIHLCFFNIAPPHAFLFRREAVLRTGWFDSQLKACEDYDFWLRTAVNGSIPQYNPEGIVYYRRHLQSMSANFNNQYLHDAIMHNRLSFLLDRYPHFPNDRRLEAYLAFSSGALLTASRLFALDSSGALDLMGLALNRVADAKKIAGSSNSGWNILIKLFILRIMACLAYPCFKDSEIKDRILENISDIMKALKAPSSNFHFIADLLTEIFFGSHKYINEKRDLIKLLMDMKFKIF